MERALKEVITGNNLTCGVAHVHDYNHVRVSDDYASGDKDHHHDDDDHCDHDHQHHYQSVLLNMDFIRSGFDFKPPDNSEASGCPRGWITNPNPRCSFHGNISVDVYASLVEKQGGAKVAVGYTNILLSMANTIIKHDVDVQRECVWCVAIATLSVARYQTASSSMQQ